MLAIALEYEKACEILAEQDTNYFIDLTSKGFQMLNEDDWQECKSMVEFLKIFYQITLRVSGSSYVTANLFFHQVTQIFCSLTNLIEDTKFGQRGSDMGHAMMNKFNKYWSDTGRLNMLMYIAVLLDPRFKFKFLEVVLHRMYPTMKSGPTGVLISEGKLLAVDANEGLQGLFKEYKTKMQPPSSSSTSQVNETSTSTRRQIGLGMSVDNAMVAWFNESNAMDGTDNELHELHKYFNEMPEADGPQFDILVWWKLNKPRFPILAEVARDVLAVPIFTVPSESAFSTSGRILDDYRSSLTPRMVEGLLCTQDWLKEESPIGTKTWTGDVFIDSAQFDDDFEKELAEMANRNKVSANK